MKHLEKITLVLAATLFAHAAFAQDAAHAVTAAATGGDRGMLGLGAGLAIGIAALGGALGQAKTAASALDGIARNPAAQAKIFTPMIIGLALIESLVIYAFVIAFFLNGKI